jgi:hypothetical protein
VAAELDQVLQPYEDEELQRVETNGDLIGEEEEDQVKTRTVSKNSLESEKSYDLSVPIIQIEECTSLKHSFTFPR